MYKKYEDLEVTLKKGLQIIKLNRPHKKNAVSAKMYEEIPKALNDAKNNDNVVITVITGAGDYYSSGTDMTGSALLDGNDITKAVEKASDNLRAFVSAFIDFPKILVALVNGPAIGIAATTLGLCDVVFASNKAKFRTPFTSLGLSAEGCSTYTFPRIMGNAKAGKMLYFNYEMSVEEAYSCGFVSQIIPHDKLPEMLQKLEEFSALPTKSLLETKRMIRRWDSEDLHKANEQECKQLEERWVSEECMNAMINFMQNRSKM